MFIGYDAPNHDSEVVRQHDRVAHLGGAFERRDYYLGGYDNGESAHAFVRYLQSLTADPMPVEAVPAKLTVRAPTPQKPLEPARK